MKLIDIIFCDDIRFEKNNKISLMGLYNDQIVFHTGNTNTKWPIPIKLATLLRFKIDSIEKYPNKFDLEYFQDKKSIGKITGDIKIENNQSYANIAIVAEGISLEPGYLGFSIKLFEENNLILSKETMNAIKILKE